MLMGAFDMGMWGLGMAAWCFRMRKTYPALMFTALHAIAQAKGTLALGLGYGKDTSIDSDRDLSTQPLIVVRIQREGKKPSPHGPLSTSSWKSRIQTGHIA